MLDTLAQDVRTAWRMMGRQKALSVAVLVTLAIGIGANTAIFSIVHGVLLRPLPFAEPGGIVRLSEAHPGANAPVAAPLLSHFTYHAWGQESATLEALAAYSSRAYVVGGDSALVRGAAVTPTLMPILRVAPAHGRGFTAADALPGAEPVVILSDGFWRERFGADPGALGTTIDLDDAPHTIIGVMPPGFEFPARDQRLWTPYRVPPPGEVQGISVFAAIGRLRTGVTPEQAAAEGTSRARAADRNETIAALIFGTGDPVVVHVRTLLDVLTGDVRPALLVLLAGVGVVLLIACVNVANLFLSRGAARQRELAIRAAVGAGRVRLVRQLLTESLVLAVAGGALGLGLGWALIATLPSIVPEGFPRIHDVRLDRLVFAFAAGAALAAGLLAGLVPALRGACPDLVPALRASGPPGGAPTHRLRAALLVAEAALAVVLVVAAGLLVRSFVRLVQVDPGYETANVMVATLRLPGPAQTPERVGRILGPLLERVRVTPGVEAAGAGNMTPLGSSTAIMGFTMAAPGGATREVRALDYVVTPGYAEALRLRLRDGRLFTASDAAAPDVMLVNEEFVRTYLADGAPVVGRRLTLPGPPDTPGIDTEIVGVVGNMLKDGLDRRPQPEIYRPPREPDRVAGEVALVLRTAADPHQTIAPLRAALADIDPQAVLDPVATLASRVDRAVAEPRFAALVLGAFALLALALAATGLYGVLSHTVAQRRREMGVRLAVGATRRDLMQLVVGQGLSMTALGLVGGLAAAAGLTRLLSGMLYDVVPLDPVSFAVAPILLLAVALVASLLPALRASATNPVDALRSE